MGSSSKRKSSKKKSSKISSQPRRMKKSRKSKSEKLGRSYDSSDDSTSSKSISSPSYDSLSSKSVNDSMSSSSEDSYRSRKKVSNLRSKMKSGKRARRRSGRREISEGSSRIKKRKRSCKNIDSKSRKKSKKKKPRRDMSTGSTSSDSYSCSTCEGEISNFSEESEHQRLRIRSAENKKDKQVSRKERIRTKKKTHRSSSCSSYGRSRDPICCVSPGDENFMGEAKSKRLRSIITVAEQFHEKDGNKLEKDPLKEEMVYDRDDYPSSRNNDSSGRGSERELTSQSPVSSNKRQGNNIKDKETFACNSRLTKNSESRKDVHDQIVNGLSLNKVETSKSEKETQAAAPLTGAGFGGDGLEATLRQKALENFRKFRGGLQTSVKTTANQQNKDDGDVNQSSTTRAELVKRGVFKQDNSNVIGSVEMLNRSTRLPLQGEVTCFTRAVQGISDGEYTGKISESVEQNINHPTEGLVFSGDPLRKDHTQSVVVSSEYGNSSLKDQSAGTNSTLNQKMLRQAYSDKIATQNKEIEGKNSPKMTQAMPPSVTDNQGTGALNSSSSPTVNLASRIQSTLGGQGLNDRQEEAKDGSQFEQKTMSVMRGGEMVQVSYKVYIPKRTPALSRRQLKR